MPITSQSSNNLVIDGPSMLVNILPPFPVIQFLKSENKSIPQKQLLALIDTGCTKTCIDRRIAEKLELIPHDRTIVYTPNGPSEQYLYDVVMMFQATGEFQFSMQILDANLEGQCYQALIGRDFLEQGIFIYNGIEHSWNFCV